LQTKDFFLTFLAAFGGVGILLFLDINTLFLAALLLSVILFKTQKEQFSTIVAVWFALSVAPAYGVVPSEIFTLANGFLLQTLASVLFFIIFNIKKPSLIGRLYNNAKNGVLLSHILSGFAGGIVSAALWQGYLNFI